MDYTAKIREGQYRIRFLFRFTFFLTCILFYSTINHTARLFVLCEVEYMNRHYRKMIAPIVITVLLILYYVAYFGVFIILLDIVWKYLLGIIPIVISALLIAVCYERVKEIKGGEEDDISKY